MSHQAVISAPSVRSNTAAPARVSTGELRHEGLIRCLLPLVYAGSVAAMAAAGASAVWQPLAQQGFQSQPGGLVFYSMPIFHAMVWTGALAGLAAGLVATGVVLIFALFGPVSWRALTVVGLINGLLGGLLLLDAANIGVGRSGAAELQPIVSLEVGMVLAPLLSLALVVMYHYCLRPAGKASDVA